MKYLLLLIVTVAVFVFCAVERYGGRRNSVPPLAHPGKGILTEAGSRDAFEKATGISLPESVKPKLGTFQVWDEKEYGGENRSYHTAAFVAPPAEVLALADAVESKWREVHGGNPNVTIRRSPGSKQWYSEGKMEFLPGTIGVSMRDRYASYTELNVGLKLDPSTGNVLLMHYRGRQDDPSSRFDEEEERRQKERDAKATAEWEARRGAGRESK